MTNELTEEGMGTVLDLTGYPCRPVQRRCQTEVPETSPEDLRGQQGGRWYEATLPSRGPSSPVRVAVALSAVLLVMLFAAGCVAGTPAADGPSKISTPKTLNKQVGSRPADFEILVYQGADALGGQQVQFSDLLAQGKPVVLNMWAGLCPPCRAEMPDLQKVSAEYEGRVLLLGLDVGPFVGLGSRADGRALLRELEVTYPNGTTNDPEVVRSYNLLGMPSTFFIKPNGEVQRRWTGILTKDKLVELVEELLAASAGS